MKSFCWWTQKKSKEIKTEYYHNGCWKSAPESKEDVQLVRRLAVNSRVSQAWTSIFNVKSRQLTWDQCANLFEQFFAHFIFTPAKKNNITFMTSPIDLCPMVKWRSSTKSKQNNLDVMLMKRLAHEWMRRNKKVKIFMTFNGTCDFPTSLF